MLLVQGHGKQGKRWRKLKLTGLGSSPAWQLCNGLSTGVPLFCRARNSLNLSAGLGNQWITNFTGPPWLALVLKHEWTTNEGDWETRDRRGLFLEPFYLHCYGSCSTFDFLTTGSHFCPYNDDNTNTNSNNRLFMVSHLVRAQSAYKDIGYTHFITQTHTDACMHTHTLQIHALLVIDW